VQKREKTVKENFTFSVLLEVPFVQNADEKGLSSDKCIVPVV
jgi:hypothetical protein